MSEESGGGSSPKKPANAVEGPRGVSDDVICPYISTRPSSSSLASQLVDRLLASPSLSTRRRHTPCPCSLLSPALPAPPPAPSLSLAAARSLHSLPQLDYAYDALEPHISAQIMELHHSKHHQAYVNGLNAAERSYAQAPSPKDQIRLQPALKFNGGGHINHSLFWKNLAPQSAGGGELVAGPLKDALVADFGSVDAFKKKVNTVTAAIQGSGWGWLGYSPETKRLEVVTTANQDPLLTHVPIIGIDIWEHAFYLQYHNLKADYLTAIWNVINFKEAERRFIEASKQ